jgi:cytochrome P450
VTDIPRGESAAESLPQIPIIDLGEVPHVASDPNQSLYIFFDRLRELSPVVQCRTTEGSWYAFLRAATAKAILMDTATFKTYHPDARASGYFEEELLPASKDPPEHKKYRQIIQAPFSARVAKALEPRMRNFAVGLIDEIAPRGACEFIEIFALPYPGLVFLELMKFPLEDLAPLTVLDSKFWTPPAADPDGSIRKSGLGGLKDYVREQLRRKRKAPDDSLISLLISADIEGQRLTDDEIVSYGTLACIGGIHTTKAVLGRMMLHLAKQPGQRRRLRERPALIRHFVDEALRVYAIGESFRFASRDITIDGCPLKRGDRISVHWPAINRDPREYSNPTEIHLDDPPRSNLAFGYGPHFCVGMHVARHDMAIAIEEWQRRIPEFELEKNATLEERVWGGAGLYALPLRWTPEA